MKRLFTLLLTLGVGISLFASKTAVGGVYYDFNSKLKTASVTYQGSTLSSDYYAGEVVIPATVTFRNEEYKVTSVGEYAFSNSTKLTKVSFEQPSNVVTIQGSAFRNCSALAEVVLPESLTSLGTYVFYSCTALTSIVIPESVTSVGQGLFEYCTNLKSVKLSNQLKSLGDYSFQFCENLPSIVLPAQLRVVDNSLFSMCKRLTEISIPPMVEEIGENAFRGCEQLQTLNFEGTVLTDIRKQAFLDCVSLLDVQLPEGLYAIQESAFSGCSRMKRLWLPASLQGMGAMAFKDCSSLQEIYSMAVNPPMITIQRAAMNNSFAGVDAETPVYVPCGSENAYKEEWTCFTNIQVYGFNQYKLTVLPVEGHKPGYATITKVATCDNPSYQIKAVAGDGYEFIGWDDGNNNAVRSIILSKDSVITAIFKRPEPECEPFSFSARSADESMGSVIVSQYPSCDNEHTAVFAAVANEGFEFTGWSDQVKVAERRIILDKDVALIAYFKAIDIEPELFTVSLYKDDEAKPFAVLYKVEEGTPLADLLADYRPEDAGCLSYANSAWKDMAGADAPEKVASDLNLVIIGNKAVNSIVFMIIGDKEPVKTISDIDCGSDISEYASVEAPEREGFVFSGWNGWPDDNLMPAHDLYIYGSYTQKVIEKYLVKFFVNNSLFDAALYAEGDIIELPENEPEVACGLFKGWKRADNGVMLDEDEESRLMPAKILRVDAQFDMSSVPQYIVVSANTAQGSVEIIKAPVCDDLSIKVAAVAKEGYEFAGWNNGDITNPREGIVYEGMEWIASFAPVSREEIQRYMVMVTVNDDAMGYVNKRARFEAVPEEGAVFSGWQTGETINPIEVKLNEDNINVVYIASFMTESQRNQLPALFRRVSADNGKIDILGQDDKMVDIYNAAGQVVYSGKARAGIVVPESGRYLIYIDSKIGVIDVK